ncbi:MAG: hypothetical protein GXY32_07745 [Ruminococcaceae bacterium]|nr:hypothetical protein [Oscillospiraceae bacterium]
MKTETVIKTAGEACQHTLPGVRLTMNGNQTALRAVWRDSLARLQNRIGFEVVLV